MFVIEITLKSMMNGIVNILVIHHI